MIIIIFRWYVSFWDTCSLTCGQGYQQRSVICRQKVSENKWKTLENETRCTQQKPEVSPLIRNCSKINCPPEYVGKEWSKVSRMYFLDLTIKVIIIQY